MPKELIFTSVPSGIESGSSGYCTVAKHKGIDRILTRALEGASFYELMNMAEKPVVHAYRILNLPTGTFYALTRICYSGSDHTGRTNYLAHNLVFSKEEIPQGITPAEIFLRGEGWISVWPKDAPPAFFSEGSNKVSIPPPSQAHQTLSTWQKHAGAGSLAHELLPRGSWKFFTQKGAHTDTLSIIAETTSLPDGPNKQMAWDKISFTTFLQPADKAEDFMVAAGDESSPALSALRRNALRLPLHPNPGACFCPAGATAFGLLPSENIPVVPATEAPVVENVFEEETEQTTRDQIPHDPFADEPDEVSQVLPAGSNISVSPDQSQVQGAQSAGVSGQNQPLSGSDLGTLTEEESKKSNALWFVMGGFGLAVIGCVVALFIIRPWESPQNKEIDIAAGRKTPDSSPPETPDPEEPNKKKETEPGEKGKEKNTPAPSVKDDTPKPTQPEVPKKTKPAKPAPKPDPQFSFPTGLLTDDKPLNFEVGKGKGDAFVWNREKPVPQAEFPQGIILFWFHKEIKRIATTQSIESYTITMPEKSPSTMILSNAELSKKVSKVNWNFEKLQENGWESFSAGEDQKNEILRNNNIERDKLLSYLSNKQNSYYFTTLKKGNPSYIESLLLDNNKKYDGTKEPLVILIEKIPFWVDGIQHGNTRFKDFANAVRKSKDKTVTDFENQTKANNDAEANQKRFKELTGKTVKEAGNATELHKSFEQKLKNLSTGNREIELIKKDKPFLIGNVSNFKLDTDNIQGKPLTDDEKKAKKKRKPADYEARFIQEANQRIRAAKVAWVGRGASGKYTDATAKDVKSLEELFDTFDKANKVFQDNKDRAENISLFPQSYRKEGKILIEIRK